VLGIVLPITLSLAVHVSVYVFVVVPVKIIVVVDIDVAAVPIAIAPMAAPSAPGSGTERDSCAPCQSRAWHVTRIGIRIVRIFDRSRAIHHRRIVRRHIDNVRVCLLNFDYLLSAGDCFGLHYRLFAGF
jgi:hypothetical protein